MRKFNIKINDNKIVELNQDVIGYVEESKATQIMISLNTELQSNDIDYHIVNFRHGENDEKMISQKIYTLENENDKPDAYRVDDKITMVLPQYVTRYPIIYAQVEGHILKRDPATGKSEIDTIIKSPIFMMKLDDSIVGDGGEFNSKVEGIFADMHNLESMLEAAQPVIEMIGDGIDWEDIEEASRPRILVGDGYNCTVIGDIESSQAFGDNSIAIGTGLTAYGENSVIVGKYGYSLDGLIFVVAGGNEQDVKNLLEISQEDASFYVNLYGNTPDLNAPGQAIPTIAWVKDFIDKNSSSENDSVLSGLRTELEELKNELPEGLDQVSNEILEVRDSLQGQIYANKPLVSKSLTLTKSGWVLNQNGKYTQTVLSEINAGRRNEIDVDVDSIEEWGNCFILAVREISNGVVFEANSLPSKDLSFKITSTEVIYAV